MSRILGLLYCTGIELVLYIGSEGRIGSPEFEKIEMFLQTSICDTNKAKISSMCKVRVRKAGKSVVL